MKPSIKEMVEAEMVRIAKWEAKNPSARKDSADNQRAKAARLLAE